MKVVLVVVMVRDPSRERCQANIRGGGKEMFPSPSSLS